MKLDPTTRTWLGEQLGRDVLCVLQCAAFGSREPAWEACRDHLERDASVLASRATATDRGRPYATLQRLLAVWVASEPRPTVQRMCRGLRRLRLLVPELGDADGILEPTGIQADLTTLTCRLAEKGPVWLLIDALHWADADSLAMLLAVTAGAGPLPIGVCGTVDAAWVPPVGVRVHRVDVSNRRATPDTPEIQAHIREGMAVLDRDSRLVLEVLSLAPGPVELDALDAALPEGLHLDTHLDTLEQSGWVRSENRGAGIQLVARDPLCMDAVGGQISPRRRQLLHAAWLAAPLDATARLHHTIGAGTRAGADAVVRIHEAGVHELRATRHGEALPLLELAHDLSRRREGASADLLEDLGTARRGAFDVEGARQAWTEALVAGPTPAGVARLHRALAMLAWDLGDSDGALAQVQAGWRALEGRSGPEVEALARAELVFLDRRLRYDVLEDAARRLLAVADAPDAVSEALLVLATVQAQRGDPTARESIERAIAAARDGQEARVLDRARHGRNMFLIGTGRPREVQAAVDAENDRSVYATFARLLAANFLADDEGFTEIVKSIPERWLGNSMVTMVSCQLRADGDLDQLVVDPGDERAQVMTAYFKATIHELHERPEAVVATLQAVAMSGPAEIRGPFRLQTARILGVAYARTGRGAEALALGDWLADRPEPFALEAAAWVRGVVEGNGAALTQVADALARRGLRRMEATCRVDAVRCATPPSNAKGELLQAWQAVVHLGCDPELARLRQGFASLGLRPPATPRRRSTTGPLSAREREVAELVAEGLSNKEVATRLYVSPATVATHLKRIYKRLGVHSRAGLTRWMMA